MAHPSRFGVRTGVLASLVLVLVTPTFAVAQSTPPAAVVVHVESDRPMDLLAAEPDPSVWSTAPRWRHVCSAPCDREVPIEATYRLDGDGSRATLPFRLVGGAGERVVITVDRSSTSAFVGGTALAIVGFVGAGVGAIVTLVALFPLNPDAPPGQHRGVDVTALVVGTSALVGGLTAAVIGSIVRRNNKESGATQSIRAANTGDHAEPSFVGPGPLRRLPAWSEMADATRLRADPVKPVLIPLWKASF